MQNVKTNSYIEKIRKCALEFMKDERVRIYLFGLWARGEARCESDVDIAIEGDDRLKASKISALRDFFEESTIPYRVDVVDMRRASEELKEEIRRDGILWKQ